MPDDVGKKQGRGRPKKERPDYAVVSPPVQEPAWKAGAGKPVAPDMVRMSPVALAEWERVTSLITSFTEVQVGPLTSYCIAFAQLHAFSVEYHAKPPKTDDPAKLKLHAARRRAVEIGISKSTGDVARFGTILGMVPRAPKEEVEKAPPAPQLAGGRLEAMRNRKY